MKRFTLLAIGSFALNAALLTYVILPGTDRPGHSPSSPEGTLPAPSEKKAPSGMSGKTAPSAQPRGGWKQWESDDPAVLLARLREAGFPPDIVRSIITAQVARQFAAHRKELFARETQNPFWKPPAGPRFDAKTMAEFRELSRAQIRTLNDILGPDSSDPESNNPPTQQFGDISVAKVRQIDRITSDYNDLRADVYTKSNGVLLPEDKSKLALLQKEQREDVEKLLTPKELEEYDLRTSQNANWLRSQLAIFQPTEQEFRALFAATRPATQERTAAAQKDPVGSALATLLAKAPGALSPERYNELKMVTDPSYQNAYRITERLELPASVARDVVGIQQDIQERVKATSRSVDLSPDMRRQQLAGLQAEAKDRLTQALTPTGFDVYQQNGGSWVQSIQSRPAPAPPSQ